MQTDHSVSQAGAKTTVAFQYIFFSCLIVYELKNGLTVDENL